MRRRIRRAQHRAHQFPQRLPAPPIRHPRRNIESRNPEAAARLLLPGLAAGTPQTRGAGSDDGGRDLLPARGLHATDGQARRNSRHHFAVEVAGVGDGQGTRHRRGSLPHPPPGRRPIHLRGRRRPGPQGPRGRAGGQRARPDRGRGQQGGLPRDPRYRRHDRRGRGRLVDVLAVADRPRTVRGQTGHQRRPRRPGGRDRRHPARRHVAALQNPLHDQPNGHHPESLVAVGTHPAALGVRPTRRRIRCCTI
ncbi:Truncated IS1081 transposase (part1) [Mycobacteroides abscessus]|nr:Truncated IS1081 transposase (part1) [Mycobacteroides abscessus]SKV96112.1 Truncated IS1081 transposase (part1) [Mycobacteroides abscessus subsp. massiliense]SKW98290.1 Truncated IS1081 transposase (part1) [Mycobacteroides abscessus subsp. massiliense]